MNPADASHEGMVLAERWRVGHRIGIGGMAVVYAAEDLRLQRKVACKILHRHLASSEAARARMAREAQALAQVRNENIIEIYDFSGADPECTYIVMELVEGCSLRQFIDHFRHPLPEIALMIVAELLSALRAAHARGVVHRDVKPDNVLIGREGRPKLGDFGIARRLSDERITVTGNLMGSPSYMSPEQATGAGCDHRSDLFSLGIVLYQLVTGTLPFAGRTPVETLQLVATNTYQDPIEVTPACGVPIASIIRRSMAPVRHRYDSAERMLKEVQEVLRDAGLSQVHRELPRYFSEPRPYIEEIRPRLAQRLEEAGLALARAGTPYRAYGYLDRAAILGRDRPELAELRASLVDRATEERPQKRDPRTQAALWAFAAAAFALALYFLMTAPAPNRPSGARPSSAAPKGPNNATAPGVGGPKRGDGDASTIEEAGAVEARTSARR